MPCASICISHRFSRHIHGVLQRMTWPAPSAYIGVSVTQNSVNPHTPLMKTYQTTMGPKRCCQSDDTLGKEYCNTGSALLQRYILPRPAVYHVCTAFAYMSTKPPSLAHCIKPQKDQTPACTASIGLADHHASAVCAGHRVANASAGCSVTFALLSCLPGVDSRSCPGL